MKNDALDVVLRNIEDNEDWLALCQICECGKQAKLETSSRRQLIKFFNEEIRHNYGHTLANLLLFRDEYTPDYDDILKATAEHLSIDNIPEKLTIRDVEHLENNIIAKGLENIKESIIKDKGLSVWENMERVAMSEIAKLYTDGKISTEDYGLLKRYACSEGLLAAVASEKLTGFTLYLVIQQLFFVMGRYLAQKMGIGVTEQIVGSTMFLIPAVWVLLLGPVIYELGNTNWTKTIGVVIYIAAMRKKQCYPLD